MALFLNSFCGGRRGQMAVEFDTDKAADQNYADAQYFLGCMVDDRVEAVKWWHKAAEQGFTLAQYNLGVCYRTGQGVATNYVEAAQWFRRAAEQGHAPSQSSLGAFYAIGEGVPRDLVEAYKWRNLASAQGETNAMEARDALEHLMTPAQIAEAQQLSMEFKPHK
jgi:TPR repeat protein